MSVVVGIVCSFIICRAIGGGLYMFGILLLSFALGTFLGGPAMMVP